MCLARASLYHTKIPPSLVHGGLFNLTEGTNYFIVAWGTVGKRIISTPGLGENDNVSIFVIFCAYCPYLLRSWLHSVCSISLIGTCWLQLQHCSVLSAVGASLDVGWVFVSSFLRGFDGQQVDVKLVTAGLQVCREPLVGVVDDVWCLSRRCLSSPGPEGDVWACRGE